MGFTFKIYSPVADKIFYPLPIILMKIQITRVFLKIYLIFLFINIILKNNLLYPHHDGNQSHVYRNTLNFTSHKNHSCTDNKIEECVI